MRRQWRRCYPLLCVVILLTLGGCQKTADKEVQREVFAMDTYMNLRAYGEGAQQGLTEAVAEIERLEGLFGVNEPQSDLSRIRQADGQAVTVSEETAELLQTALTIGQQTEGALDVTIYPVLRAWGFTGEQHQVPSDKELQALLPLVDHRAVVLEGQTVTVPSEAAVDLGAVAKGYTSDRLCTILREHGVTSALLNLGGNVQAIGTKPDGSRWKVGIAHPQGGEPIAVLSIADAAVITSGSYERCFTAEDGTQYHHIIDPQTGYPVRNGLTSVTVIGQKGVLCDALSTAFFVMGQEKSADFWRAHPEIEVVWINEENHLYLTEGLRDVVQTEAPCTIIERGAA